MFWSVQFPGEDFVRADRQIGGDWLHICDRARSIELELGWIDVLLEDVNLSDS
jgi:hypothetical protein